eukprot:TRINITY_DN13990_c0_g1_i1.p1 TRINITY_DN13990_c0_g1~~TRINITY_DN13990_c0_g1_i1.p1  ORF type:complete len:553 (+),score=141.64 TRINITY_DN13990_c0_g1_i1:180-1838(+)
MMRTVLLSVSLITLALLTFVAAQPPIVDPAQMQIDRIDTSAITIRGTNFGTNNSAIFVSFINSPATGCVVSNATNVAFVCTLVKPTQREKNESFAVSGVIIAQVVVAGVAAPFPAPVVFVVPVVEEQVDPPVFDSGRNQSTGQITLNGVGFSNITSDNIVLLWPRNASTPIPIQANVIESNFTRIVAEIPAHPIAGVYDAQVLPNVQQPPVAENTTAAPAAPSLFDSLPGRDKALAVIIRPTIRFSNVTFCCINETLIPVLVTGSGFSFFEEENDVVINDPAAKDDWSCEPFGFGFPGNDTADGIMVCMLRKLPDGVVSVQVQARVRGVASQPFQIQGPGAEDTRQRVAGIAIASIYGFLILVLLVVIVAFARVRDPPPRPATSVDAPSASDNKAPDPDFAEVVVPDNSRKARRRKTAADDKPSSSTQRAHDDDEAEAVELEVQKPKRREKKSQQKSHEDAEEFGAEKPKSKKQRKREPEPQPESSSESEVEKKPESSSSSEEQKPTLPEPVVDSDAPVRSPSRQKSTADSIAKAKRASSFFIDPSIYGDQK